MKSAYTQHILLLVLFSLSLSPLTAQQIPFFGYDHYDTRMLNPARTGEAGGLGGVLYRNQWAGALQSGENPVTFRAFIDPSGPLGLTNNKIGLALSLTGDRVYGSQNTSIDLQFAYHLVHEDNLFISAGIIAGVRQFKSTLVEDDFRDGADPYAAGAIPNQMGFDGGPGLYITYKPIDDQRLRLGVTLPQLFTSDVETGTTVDYETLPHLIISASYYIGSEVVSVEPSIQMQSIGGGYDGKTPVVNLGGRVHFLEDRLHLGAGYRLNASSYNVQLGVKATEQLMITGLYENRRPTAFGSVFELGIQYSFADPGTPDKPDKPDPIEEDEPIEPETVPSGISESQLTTQFNQAQQTFSLAERNFNPLQQDASGNLQTTRGHFEDARRPGMSTEGIVHKMRKANDQLEILRPQVADIERYADLMETAYRDALTASNQADRYDYKISGSSRKLRNMNSAVAAARAYADNLSQQFDRLETEIRSFEASKGLNEIDIRSSITAGNLDAVESYYQSRINRLLAKPYGLQPIVLEEEGNVLVWTVQFEDDSQAYLLDTDKAAHQGLVDQLASLISDFREAGYSVESMEIVSDLQLGTGMIGFDMGIPYEQEFGSIVIIDYQLVDLEAGSTPEQRSMTIRSGNLNLEQLALLKGKGIQERLSDRIPTSGMEMPMILRAGNDQDAQQVITIRLRIE